MKKLICALLLVAGVREVSAFSLLGPFDTWQTTDIGYNLTLPNFPDVGGPMNIGEEYRWNSPVIVYSFDPSFLNYFGDKGVAAVEAAVNILNSLPPFSQMSPKLTEFPTDTRRFNYQATALGIRDLKSWALSALLESLGLATPERYSFTIRERFILPSGAATYVTVRRNFDPETSLPTSYINGTLYTFNIRQTFISPPFDAWEAVPIAVDPLAPSVTSVAAYVGLMGGTTDARGSGVIGTLGMFYTGLTRDDVGGLRYLLRKTNFKVDTIPADAGSPTSGAAGAGGNLADVAWLPVPGQTTGGTTQAGGAGVGGVGGVGGGAGTVTSNLVATALRPGPDRIQLRRVDFNSLLGQFAASNTLYYADTYMTNGTSRQQVVQRTLTQPDILFTAGDLGENQGAPILFTRTITFVNNTTLNTLGTTAQGGPGSINGPVQINFSKTAGYFSNGDGGTEETAFRGLVWGSFDASTNAPIIYPVGSTLRDLESVVLKKSGPGSAWRIP